MKTMTRINAFALLAVAAVALGVASWGTKMDERGAPSVAVSEVPAAAFTVKIASGWLAPGAAREQIEQQSAALERLAADHQIAVRVLRSDAQLRTRDLRGARLHAPLARFERFFVIQTHDVDSLSAALAGQAIELEHVVQGTDVAGSRLVPQDTRLHF
jgi:hypothetical protein